MIEGDHAEKNSTSSQSIVEIIEMVASSSAAYVDGSSRWSANRHSAAGAGGSRRRQHHYGGGGGQRTSLGSSSSSFKDDAFEKVTVRARKRKRLRQRHPPSSRNNEDAGGNNEQLMKVLEDFLLLRTTDQSSTKTKNNQPVLDVNGQKPIACSTDPLVKLFEPIVEELTAVDQVPVPIVSKKRKNNDVTCSSTQPPSRRDCTKAVDHKKPENKKKKLLVNGNVFALKSFKQDNSDDQLKTVELPVAVVQNHNANAGSSKIVPKPKKNSTPAATIAKQTKNLVGTASKSRSDKNATKPKPGLKLKLKLDFATKNSLLDLKDKMKLAARKQMTDKLKKVQEVKRRVRKKKVVPETPTPTPSPTETSSTDVGSAPSVKATSPMFVNIRMENENKNEKVCQKCEKVAENLVRCKGSCHGMFHTGCMSSPADQCPSTVALKCDECASNLHSCFVCKSKDGVVRQCSVRMCGKFYHIACLSTYRAANIDPKGTPFTCPLHVCLSCILSSDKTTAANRNRMYRCVRCPVAYHSTEACFAAGSIILSSACILCPVHHKSKKGRYSQINVNWCFVCSHGGSLICCETCPASFHAECLNMETPEGSYYCVECQSKSQPKYGDIVWVKLGNYRWWPAKVCNPKYVPLNIKTVHHELGDFPVRFFGTYDYYWTRRSRTFQFLEGDHVANTGSTNKLGQIFKTALEEAVVAFQKWKSAKETREAHNHEKNNLKPPHYTYLKTNRPVGNVSAVSIADPLTMTSCDCDPTSENPCGPNSECLNRLLMLECSPSTCPAGDRCQNQQFVKQQYVKAEIFRTDGKGWGLRSLVDIFKGQFVNEYVGEMIDENECKRRMQKMQEENDTAFYFLTLDKDRIIDAGKKGNLSRFMNHSCQPNCELRKWTVNGDTRVGLFALCEIATGVELTFNYNLECLGNEKAKCRCAAPNCSGFIGERPKTLVSTTPSKRPPRSTPKARRRRSRAKAHYDSECFRCGLDGELLLCDRKNCTKVFHLSCLNMEKAPHGRWECPWHHCDICGKMASVLCSTCPNSFCLEHVDKNVRYLPDGTVFCLEHDAIESLQSSSTETEAAASETEEPAQQSITVTLELIKSDDIENCVPEATTNAEEQTAVAISKHDSTTIEENSEIVVKMDACTTIGEDKSEKLVAEIALVAKKISKQTNCVKVEPRNGTIVVDKHLATTTIVIDEQRTNSTVGESRDLKLLG